MVGWQDARDRLKKIREEKLRRSQEVIDLWESVLQKNISKLGNDVWTIYEQVCIAALDNGQLDLSTDFVKKLDSKFPSSGRVRRLAAMHLETCGKFDEARRIYDSLIESDETDTLSRKRLIAILKAQQKHDEAIDELNSYLKSFQNDQEAWLELCDLYCHEGDYAKARFCMEEVMLHFPHSHLHHQRYAEIRFALGGYENIEVARSHFAKAAKLCPTNADAVYGLALTAGYLANSSRSTTTQKKENHRYASWATSCALDKHSEKLEADAKEKLENLQILMDSIQI